MYLKYIIWILFLTNLNLFSQESNHPKIFFEVPDSFKTEEYSDDLKNWRTSIFKKYHIEDDIINEEIFLKTDIKLNVNGLIRKDEIYQSITNLDRFFIKASHVIVDFKLKTIGTMGVSGISSIKPKTKPIVIVMAPKKEINLLGITLFDDKVQGNPPVFNEKSVLYYWRVK